MRPLFFCVCFLAVSSILPQLTAQTSLEADAETKRQIAALRDAVIQQTRQIDALTAEIERLGIALGQRRPAKTEPVAVAPTPAPLGQTTVTGAAVAPATPTATPVPTATPDPNSIQHTVVKGENLTIIAKKYSTTIDAIQKLNKITDARKMQVGQILAIPKPSPTPSSAASPTPATP